MDKDELKIEKYKISIELLKYEGEMLWQIMSVYMVINTILLGFISQLAFKNSNEYSPMYHPICFSASVFGLIILLPWLGTFIRNSDYYFFRMAQAKESEPDEWNLLKKDGANFAKGNQVKIEKQSYQIGRLGRFMKNKQAVYCMIVLFAISYFILIILYGPWWPSC